MCKQFEGLVKLQQIFNGHLAKVLESAMSDFMPVIFENILPHEFTKRKWKDSVYAVQLVFEERGKPPKIKLNNEIEAEIEFTDGKKGIYVISQRIWERFHEIKKIRAINDAVGRHITFLTRIKEGGRILDYKGNMDLSKVYPIFDVGKDVMQCETCGRWFPPDATNAWRQKYCSEKCRYSAAYERKKKKK